MKKKGIVIGLLCLIAVLAAAVGVLLFLSRDNGTAGTAASKKSSGQTEDRKEPSGQTEAGKDQKVPEEGQKEEPEEAARGAFEGGRAGNTAGNLNNGGYVVENETDVFYCRKDGLFRRAQDGSGETKLYDGACSSLNLWGDTLYFLSEENLKDSDQIAYKLCTPCKISTSGSGFARLGAAMEEGRHWSGYNSAENHLDNCAVSAGYRGFVVYDGSIYYLGSSKRTGTYRCSANFSGEERNGTMTYVDNVSLYRMDLEGGNVTELVGNLGNASPQMCISDGQIYYTVSYCNGYFSPYDFTKFCKCSLDGSGYTELPAYGGLGIVFDSDFGSYVEYVLGIQVMDGKLYVSCGDSEGDFPDSRFHVYSEADETLGEPLFEERCWNQTVAFGGSLYRSAGDRNFAGGDPVLTNRALSVQEAAGGGGRLLKVFDETTYGTDEYYNNFYYDINVTDGWVYYRTADPWGQGLKEELGRLSPDGTRQEVLAVSEH